MRLLQTMAGAQFGGAEAFFVRLAIALEKTDVEQQVIIREFRERRELLNAHGVDCIELPFGGALDLKTKFSISKAIKKFQPDVVLTWMNRATSKTPAGKGRFVKVARLGGYYDLKYYRDCDHLVGNTQDIVDYLIREGWPADRAHYVPNFVSSNIVEPASRRDLSTPEEAPLILSLGRLHENKAFDTLIHALVQVPDAYLWIAGEGPLRQELELLAEKLGVRPRVRFLGWRKDISALYAACDVYVCPSRHEPLGNVVLEAWSHGRPVVAAKSQGPVSLIEHGNNGLLCDIDDSAQMAKEIKEILFNQDVAQDLAKGGWASYQKDFTEKVEVEKYLDFFEKVSKKV